MWKTQTGKDAKHTSSHEDAHHTDEQMLVENFPWPQLLNSAYWPTFQPGCVTETHNQAATQMNSNEAVHPLKNHMNMLACNKSLSLPDWHLVSLPFLCQTPSLHQPLPSPQVLISTICWSRSVFCFRSPSVLLALPTLRLVLHNRDDSFGTGFICSSLWIHLVPADWCQTNVFFFKPQPAQQMLLPQNRIKTQGILCFFPVQLVLPWFAKLLLLLWVKLVFSF